MNSFNEAFMKIGVAFESIEMTEEEKQKEEQQYQLDKRIEMLEGWYKLITRESSDKEKYNFIVKYGFISIRQFEMWLKLECEYSEMEYELEERIRLSNYHKGIIDDYSKQISLKKQLAKSTKDNSTYKFMIRQMGIKDVTPYGEDLSKRPSIDDLIHERKKIDIDWYINNMIFF